MVWKAIDQSRMSAKNKIFVKLCLIYGCRNGEMRLARKEHFDLKTMVWTVPAENHKLGKTTQKPLLRLVTPEIEPLIRQAIALSGDSDFLFTNTGSDEPMGKSAPLALPYNIMQWLRRHEEYEMKHWSIHDLRKTARTNFSTLTEPHVAEIMLGHKLPDRGRSTTITTMSPNRRRHTARGANALRNSLPKRTSDLWLAERNRGYRPRFRHRSISRVRRTHPRVLRS